MELLVALLIFVAFVAFGGLAWVAGTDSRDGFADPRVRQPRFPVRRRAG